MSYYQLVHAGLTLVAIMTLFACFMILRQRLVNHPGFAIVLTISVLLLAAFFLIQGALVQTRGVWLSSYFADPLQDPGSIDLFYLSLLLGFVGCAPFIAAYYMISLLLRFYRGLLQPQLDKGAQNLAEAGMDRGAFLKQSTLLALGFAPVVQMSTFAGMVRWFGNDIEITEHTYKIAALHHDLEGLRIVQISDLHIGPLIGPASLQQWSSALTKTRGDLLVITGDLIDLSNYYLPAVQRFLYSIQSNFPAGVLLISGNHDYYDNIYDWQRLLNSIGKSVRLLRNQIWTLQRGEGRMQFLGLDYKTDALDAYALIQRAQPELPLIILNHDPADFMHLQYTDADLVLSGHTHGGQLRVRTESGLDWTPLFKKEYVQSFYDGQPGIDRADSRSIARLYVNRGLGHSVPLRVGAAPEISCFELSRT